MEKPQRQLKLAVFNQLLVAILKWLVVHLATIPVGYDDPTAIHSILQGYDGLLYIRPSALSASSQCKGLAVVCSAVHGCG